MNNSTRERSSPLGCYPGRPIPRLYDRVVEVLGVRHYSELEALDDVTLVLFAVRYCRGNCALARETGFDGSRGWRFGCESRRAGLLFGPFSLCANSCARTGVEEVGPLELSASV